MADGQNKKCFMTAVRCELISLLHSREQRVPAPASPGAGWPLAPAPLLLLPSQAD